MIKYIFILFYAHLVSAANAAAPSSLYYTGSGFVAGGETENLTSDQGYQFSQPKYTPKKIWSFSIDGSAISQEPQNTQSFLIYLAAPIGEQLQIGSYINAVKAPAQATNQPGLSFAANGRASSQITGSFNILDITFENNLITSLAVDFIQNDEGGFAGQTFGSFRYQSYVPLTTTIPEPPSLLLMSLGLAAVVSRHNRKEKIARKNYV